MDRLIKYIGSTIYDWDFTAQNQATMVGLSKLTSGLLGSSTLVNALACTPTGPASLNVQVGLGEIYQLTSLEATLFGSMPVDTSDTIVKQGVNLGATVLPCPPPGTVGQSINYLIEAQYQDSDVSVNPTTGAPNIVLSFYNSSNPASPWAGPNNSGATSNTIRKGIVALQAKAGTAATTGTQTTPSADAGWVGLYVVTVANGQSTITSGNISVAAGAPFITETLTQKISQTTGDGRYLQIGAGQNGINNYAIAAGGPNVWTASLSPALTSYVDGMRVFVRFSATNTSASPTININGLGAVTIFEADGATGLPIGLLPLNAMLLYDSTSGGFALISAAPITTGVVSFNTRTGAVTLTSGDVTTALGFTPLDRAGSNSGTAKITFFTSTTGSASINIPQGAVPTAPANGDIWTTSTGVFARINGSTQQLATTSGAVSSFNTRTGTVTLSTADVTTALSGATLTGELTFLASGSGSAGVNFGIGSAPTSPNNGDFWLTSTGPFVRIGGATLPILTGQGTTVVGDFVAWNNTTGSAIKDVAAASASQIWTGTDNGSPVTSLSLANAQADLVLVDGATVNWNMAQGFNATWTIGANNRSLNITNPITNANYRLKIVQPASGGPFTMSAGAWPSNFDWGGAGAPTLSTGANIRDVVSLEWDAGTSKFIAMFWRGS